VKKFLFIFTQNSWKAGVLVKQINRRMVVTRTKKINADDKIKRSLYFGTEDLDTLIYSKENLIPRP